MLIQSVKCFLTSQSGNSTTTRRNTTNLTDLCQKQYTKFSVFFLLVTCLNLLFIIKIIQPPTWSKYIKVSNFPDEALEYIKKDNLRPPERRTITISLAEIPPSATDPFYIIKHFQMMYNYQECKHNIIGDRLALSAQKMKVFYYISNLLN